MDLRLRDRVAIVTGAGGGAMGTGVCLELAREGAVVVTNDIDRSWADKVAAEVEKLGSKSMPAYADVTKFEDCREMVDRTVREFGRVDILMAVPACVFIKPFHECTVEDMHKMVDGTFWGAINAIRAVVGVMIKQKSGSIVCLGSDAGKTGGKGEIIYAASKGALMTFAKGLTKEAGPHGVRINVVNAALTKTPGMMASGFLSPENEAELVKEYPLGRLGMPQDLVDAMVFLASDRASFITGQTLSVSGGRV